MNYQDYQNKKAKDAKQRAINLERNKPWYKKRGWQVILAVVGLVFLIHPIFTFELLVTLFNPYIFISGIVILIFGSKF
ncbi:hypothetical protein M8332_00975 [Fructilactobacillus ixorae]|uniref:Uncharacterized protein n=1 Tax=Fructilactobacillus ixorae TaxID=1750535 RepID=A0ABY5C3W9_9LACO|nr:hypothetical protein [Fructilactobacillus ixorae]USS93472.1 hypothetical protein M8332_00975 [Fructilactobacillus ixorae]